MVTMQHMCEVIVKSRILGDKTPGEIFSYSSSGELFMVFEWYEMAKVHLDTFAKLSNIIVDHYYDNPDVSHYGKVRY